MVDSELSPHGKGLDLEVLGAAASELRILFIDATGSGAAREIARRVHGLGRGRPGSFRVVDCGWPEALLDQQLFYRIRPGSSGAPLLEEAGRLSLELQERLLETLELRTDPRGPRPPRARGMASTSEALVQRALEGRFNERLLYRLNAIHVIVPPDFGAL